MGMKNRGFGLLILAAVLAMNCGGDGLTGPEEALVGVWTLDLAASPNENVQSETLTFDRDGTMFLDLMRTNGFWSKRNGTFSCEDGILTLVFDGSTSAIDLPFVLTGNRLTLFPGTELEEIFVR